MPFSLVDGYRYFKSTMEMESACFSQTDHKVLPESEVEDYEQRSFNTIRMDVGAKFGRKNFGCVSSFMCIRKTFVTN